jgi:ribosome-associated heat shock protein Hsp15
MSGRSGPRPGSSPGGDPDGTRQRLDKWLWFARMVKTRTLAAELAQSGHVRVNGLRAESASKQIRAGDVLTIALEHDVRVLRVIGLATRRGPYPEARLLYEDLSV